ncbi:MAG: putative ABC transporter permease protein [Chloroflexi bacterium]|nr:putative ABC transporter permease protein [Chloroflexota bacterium]
MSLAKHNLGLHRTVLLTKGCRSVGQPKATPNECAVHALWATPCAFAKTIAIGASRGERLILLVATVTATAAITSLSGIIGWVGLIIPHIARRLSGASAHHSLPVAVLLGGAFTVFCDTLARTLLPGEIPLGILTSLIGAVLFAYLMMSNSLKVKH